MSNLKGIIIDAGHGGNDVGAVNGKVYEKNLTLEISKYMYKKLKNDGINVYITRDNDQTLSPKERVKKIKSFLGTSNNIILISNHINAGGGNGAEVIYALRNNNKLANLILDNLGNSGLKKRKVYQKRLPTNTNKDYYFILRDTASIESLIVEYGFIDNSGDLSKIESNYKTYAEDVINAIYKYKGISINNKYYIVKSGDTLYSIAKKYNTTVNNLKKINNLKSNLISINQKLYLK